MVGGDVLLGRAERELQDPAPLLGLVAKGQRVVQHALQRDDPLSQPPVLRTQLLALLLFDGQLPAVPIPVGLHDHLQPAKPPSRLALLAAAGSQHRVQRLHLLLGQLQPQHRLLQLVGQLLDPVPVRAGGLQRTQVQRVQLPLHLHRDRRAVPFGCASSTRSMNSRGGIRPRK